MNEPGLKRTITTTPAILLAVSCIIGSGIFKKVSPMADNLHSPGLILLCWGVAGVISLAGALCTAELAAMMPASGGEYIYFKKIYGKLFSFLFGWANLTILKSAAIAALAYIFAESFNVIFPLPQSPSWLPLESFWIKCTGSLLIIVLSFLNHLGLVISEKFSRILILGIILAILGFVVAGLSSDQGSINHFYATAQPPQGWNLFTAIFAASLSAFWGYEGWNNMGSIGDEVVNPKRNLPIAIAGGTIIVIILFLAANAIYLYILPVETLAALAHTPGSIAAVEVARVISGQTGAMLLSALILIATLNCANSTILTSARIFFAMAKDGLFLKSAGRIHPRYQTPTVAILMQGFWSVVLLWSGSFDKLTNMIIFAAFIFYGGSAVGVVILRKREPDAERPYRVIGYPVLPVIFAAFCLALVVVTIGHNPGEALIGLGLIATGVPVYLYFVKKEEGKNI